MPIIVQGQLGQVRRFEMDGTTYRTAEVLDLGNTHKVAVNDQQYQTLVAAGEGMQVSIPCTLSLFAGGTDSKSGRAMPARITLRALPGAQIQTAARNGVASAALAGSR